MPSPPLFRSLPTPALAGAPLSGLKTIYYGGGPMYVNDLLRAIRRFGPRLIQIYGQGGAPMTITYLSKAMHGDRDHPRYLNRLASTGIARTDVEVRVVDADDRDLPVGEAGEVVVRGDVVMAGYWRDSDATETALRGGWLHTGDVGAFDGDGLRHAAANFSAYAEFHRRDEGAEPDLAMIVEEFTRFLEYYMSRHGGDGTPDGGPRGGLEQLIEQVKSEL